MLHSESIQSFLEYLEAVKLVGALNRDTKKIEKEWSKLVGRLSPPFEQFFQMKGSVMRGYLEPRSLIHQEDILSIVNIIDAAIQVKGVGLSDAVLFQLDNMIDCLKKIYAYLLLEVKNAERSTMFHEFPFMDRGKLSAIRLFLIGDDTGHLFIEINDGQMMRKCECLLDVAASKALVVSIFPAVRNEEETDIITLLTGLGWEVESVSESDQVGFSFSERDFAEITLFKPLAVDLVI